MKKYGQLGPKNPLNTQQSKWDKRQAEIRSSFTVEKMQQVLDNQDDLVSQMPTTSAAYFFVLVWPTLVGGGWLVRILNECAFDNGNKMSPGNAFMVPLPPGHERGHVVFKAEGTDQTWRSGPEARTELEKYKNEFPDSTKLPQDLKPLSIADVKSIDGAIEGPINGFFVDDRGDWYIRMAISGAEGPLLQIPLKQTVMTTRAPLSAATQLSVKIESDTVYVAVRGEESDGSEHLPIICCRVTGVDVGSGRVKLTVSGLTKSLISVPPDKIQCRGKQSEFLRCEIRKDSGVDATYISEKMHKSLQRIRRVPPSQEQRFTRDGKFHRGIIF